MKIKVNCPDEVVEVILCDVYVKTIVKLQPQIPLRSNNAKVTMSCLEQKLNSLASEYANNFAKIVEELES